MKARVKATDEIIEVDAVRRFSNERGNYIVYIDVRTLKEYDEEEVDTKDLTTLDEVRHMHTVDPDYWTRLEHQAAIAAMQGLLSDNVAMEQIVYNQEGMIAKIVANFAVTCATALIEKLKEKEERK